MKHPDYKDVDAYIAAQPEEARPLLAELRETVQAAVPGAQEAIRWGVPFYTWHGMLAGFAAYQHHAHFGTAGTGVDPAVRRALEEKGYKVLERGLQIPYGQSVPVAELTEMLQAKARENEEKRQ